MLVYNLHFYIYWLLLILVTEQNVLRLGNLIKRKDISWFLHLLKNQIHYKLHWLSYRKNSKSAYNKYLFSRLFYEVTHGSVVKNARITSVRLSPRFPKCAMYYRAKNFVWRWRRTCTLQIPGNWSYKSTRLWWLVHFCSIV